VLIVVPDLGANEAQRDRDELVAWLLDREFTEEQIRASSAPMLLPTYRIMGDDGEYVSTREIAESMNVDVSVLERLQRAVGLPRVDDPDATVFSKVDAEAAARTRYFLDAGLDVEEAVATIRVLTDSLRRFASMMRDTSYRMFFAPGATEVELAEVIEARAKESIPPVLLVVEGLLLLEFRRMYESEGIDAAERTAGQLPGARQVAVAFADLAGFTRLGEALPPEDLARLAARLADLTYEIVDEPVRFVKTIGDAVMLVSHEAAPLINAMLDLIDSAAAAGLPRLRVGVAAGPAVSRAGDWFGSPVNIANRVTGVAPPGGVLVTESARDAVGCEESLAWSSAGMRHLKGVPVEMNLFLAHRRGSRGAAPGVGR
jgi:adenylate cyclase